LTPFNFSKWYLPSQNIKTNQSKVKKAIKYPSLLARRANSHYTSTPETRLGHHSLELLPGCQSSGNVVSSDDLLQMVKYE